MSGHNFEHWRHRLPGRRKFRQILEAFKDEPMDIDHPKFRVKGTHLHYDPTVKLGNAKVEAIKWGEDLKLNPSTHFPAGKYTITVTTLGGSATSPYQVEVRDQPKPILKSFTPTSGPPGTMVTLYAENHRFNPLSVIFESSTGRSYHAKCEVTKPTFLQCRVPGDASKGSYTIKIKTRGGESKSTSTFTVP